MTARAQQQPVFQTVPNDPIGVLQYTLANGLRLFMSVNRDQPRVYTEIAVRVGSKHDPADTTGLAHYFEHMMFKGTDRLGTLDWAKEKALLDQIEALFETRRRTTDPAERDALYAEIDRLSSEAARYAAANEYDKMVQALGAQGTNAYTWVEQTVYVNDIPTNELERWFELESERFRRPVLRLFHTELETVFEEYNISQDRDFRKTSHAIQGMLTPSHPYGTQTTLGRGEDLKNPSKTNIYRFFDQYYVPNNMAIVLCGDFEPEAVVALAERHFGHFKAKTLPAFTFEPQPALKGRTHRDIYGNEAPWIEMAWRFPGAGADTTPMLVLLGVILHNDQAGIMDLNLIRQQQVLDAYGQGTASEDYGKLVLYGKPREGQSLEALEQLLLRQVECLRNGDFEDWLPQAALKDIRLHEMQGFEKNKGRASSLTNAYITGVSWADRLSRWDSLNQVSKADVVAFAQQHLSLNDYAVVYKHTGPDPSVMKLEKPKITPVEIDRDSSSAFGQEFLNKTTPDLVPEFTDFKKAVQRGKIASGVSLKAVHDKDSQLFKLYYIFEMGRSSDRRLAVLAEYVTYLGTDKYSMSAMQQAFYRLGLRFAMSCEERYLYISLSGLQESMEEGLILMEHLLHHAQPNAEALNNQIADWLKRRENNKQDKQVIMQKAMRSYAKYGQNSPYRYKFNKEELQALQPAELVGLLGSLSNYRHEVFYCGPLSVRQVAPILRKHHRVSDNTLQPTLKPAVTFKERGAKRNQVFFVNFPMVQVELYLLSKGTPRFSLEELIMAEWYNNYFGYGLSSIVFQEIRESKALAYSAYAYATSPDLKQNAHFLSAYVGTQPDKLQEAIGAFQHILEDMPVSMPQIEQARQNILKQIAATRRRKDNLYWSMRAHTKRGLTRDLNIDIYEALQHASSDDLLHFHKQQVKDRNYTWMVLGERERIDFELLKKIGPVTELTLEDIFGY